MFPRIPIHKLRHKIPFCYEYITSFDKLHETSLSWKECFYSSLKNEMCSIDKYEQTCGMFREFECVDIDTFIGIIIYWTYVI